MKEAKTGFLSSNCLSFSWRGKDNTPKPVRSVQCDSVLSEVNVT